MNAGIYKERCKRAMNLLIKKYNYDSSYFSLSDQDNAPEEYYLDFKSEEGTPMYASPKCWPQEEHDDPVCPLEILRIERRNAKTMNSRIYKKKCKRAMRELIEEYGYDKDCFDRAPKDSKYVTSDKEIVYLKKGTPIIDYPQVNDLESAHDALLCAQRERFLSSIWTRRKITES